MTVRRALVVTVSDRSARGERDDVSGPVAVGRLAREGFEVEGPTVVPDDIEPIADALRAAVQRGVDLVVTTGGTGLSSRDVTPEATDTVIERDVPGLADLMRIEGRRQTPMAVLSRARVGTAARTLIVNLPGSPAGVEQSLDAILEVVPHALDVLAGNHAH